MVQLLKYGQDMNSQRTHLDQRCIQRLNLMKVVGFNPLTPGKLRKNGTFKQQMAFFGPVWSNFVPILMKSAF